MINTLNLNQKFIMMVCLRGPNHHPTRRKAINRIGKYHLNIKAGFGKYSLKRENTKALIAFGPLLPPLTLWQVLFLHPKVTSRRRREIGEIVDLP